MKYFSQTIFQNVILNSANTSQISDQFDISEINHLGTQFSATQVSSADLSIQLQVSNDPISLPSSRSLWINEGQPVTFTGAAEFKKQDECVALKARLSVTRNAGTALVTAKTIGKTLFRPSDNLDPSWTPYYSSICAYWKMDGTFGTISNGVTIPATIGPNVTAFSPSAASLNYVAGKFNQAINFNGVDGYAVINSTLDSTSLTVNLWVKRSTLGAGGGLIGASTDDWNIYFEFDDSITFTDQNGDFSVNSGGTIEDTAWHMVTCVFDSLNSLALIYIDGTLNAQINTFGAGMPFNGGDYYVGNDVGITGALFSGAIDQILVWQNDILTANDIASLYNGGVGRSVPTSWTPPDTPTATLNMYLTMDGALGPVYPSTVLVDQVGTNNALTNGVIPLSYVAGQVGQALQFGNSPSPSTFSDASLPAGATPRSMVYWIKSSASTQFTYNVIFGYGTNAFNQAFMTYFEHDGAGNGFAPGTLVFGVYGFGMAIQGGANDGLWHHVAICFDGTTTKVYFDGVFTNSWIVPLNTVLSGAGALHFGDSLYGSVDEMAIFNNVCLTAADVLKIYNRQK